MCCSSRELDSKTRTYLVQSSLKKSFQRSTLPSSTNSGSRSTNEYHIGKRTQSEGRERKERRNTAQSWSPCLQRQRTRKMDNHYRSSEARNYSISAVLIIYEEEEEGKQPPPEHSAESYPCASIALVCRLDMTWTIHPLRRGERERERGRIKDCTAKSSRENNALTRRHEWIESLD